MGNVELLTREKVAKYPCGTMFHIPKRKRTFSFIFLYSHFPINFFPYSFFLIIFSITDFKYGLRNPTKEAVFLRFQSIVAENEEEQEDR